MVKRVLGKSDRVRQVLDDLARKQRRPARLEVGFVDHSVAPAREVEFGNATEAPRPFMRRAVMDHQGAWGPDLARSLEATGYEPRQALARMGAQMAGQIRDSLREAGHDMPQDGAGLADDVTYEVAND